MKSKTIIIALLIAAVFTLAPFEPLSVNAAATDAGAIEKDAAIQSMGKNMEALTATARHGRSDGRRRGNRYGAVFSAGGGSCENRRRDPICLF